MQTIIKRLSLILIPALSVFTLSVNAEDLYTIEDFEIADIRSGMMYGTAIENLSQYYSVNADDFEVHNFVGKVPYFEEENPPSSFVHSGDTVWIEITLHPELVTNKKTAHMVVEEIRINPKTGSSDDRVRLRAQMREEFTKKYGPPTLIRINEKEPTTSKYFWCATKPVKKFGCNIGESFASFSFNGFTLVNAKIEQAFSAELDARSK